MEAFTIDFTEQILLAATGLLCIIQLAYYLGLYSRIHRRRRALDKGKIDFSSELPPLSVIICAHNEEEQLRQNLTAVLEQDYPQFEVIVITDGNADCSEDYLKSLEERYRHLYHSFVPESSRYISRRKLAATLGIRASKYEWLVFTEAACRPQSNQWLQRMARNFTPQTSVVLGYSGYERGKGWLQQRVSYDNLFTSMRYLGAALAGHPYMGLGRNMAYRKELFYQQKGFAEHLNLQRGYDDLFINRVANRRNTRVEIDAQARTNRMPMKRAKDWREEKIGYASTARLYRGWQRWNMGFETTTRLCFLAGWTATLVVGVIHAHWLVAAGATGTALLRFGVQAYVVSRTARDLDEPRRYVGLLPLFDVLQPLQSLRWKLMCLFRKKSDFLRK